MEVARPLAAASLLLFLAQRPALAQGSACAELDTEFSAPFSGVDDHVLMLETFDLGDGPALYVGGRFDFAGSLLARGLARWRGGAWSSVGGGLGGTSPFGGQEERYVSAAVHWNGALVVGGRFSEAGGLPARNVARWDGTSWSAFGAGAFSDHQLDGVQALAVFDDGTGEALYAAGTFTTPWANVARWDGTTWGSVGGGLSGPAQALAVYDDGSGPALYVGGAFTLAGGVSAAGLARWNGAAWSAVENGGGLARASGSVSVNDLHVWNAGAGDTLFVTGSFDTAGGAPAVGLAAWDGAWSTPGSLAGGTATGYDLADGTVGSVARLLVGGDFLSVAGTPAAKVASFDGATWTGFGGTFGNARIEAVEAFDDGSTTGPPLFVGGTFSNLPPTNARFVARRGPNQWTGIGDVGSGFRSGDVAELEVVDLGAGPRLLGAGLFTAADGVAGPQLWNGSTWSCLGLGPFCLQASVGNAEVFDDGTGPAIYLGGYVYWFTGLPFIYFERWKNGASSPVAAPTSVPTALRTLRLQGQTALFTAGNTFVPGPMPDLANVYRLDGATWSQVGAGIPTADGKAVRDLAVFGGYLYAAGAFRNPGGGPMRQVAFFDGASWQPVAGGIDGDVFKLLVHDDGTGPALYAGKGQSPQPGLGAYNVVRYDGTTWSPVGDSRWGLGGSDQWGFVFDLEVYDDGTGPALYAAGRFDGGLQRWDGSAWTRVFDKVTFRGFDAHVQALATYDDGDGPSLMLAGNFDRIDDTSAYGFAEYRPSAGVGCPNMAGTAFCAGDGLGAACPCTNPGLEGHGCANVSNTDGARLVGAGDPAVGVLLHATRMSPSTRALLMSGNPLATGTPFGEGLMCLGAPVRRIRAAVAQAGRVDFAVNSPVPATVSYQVIFRNPGAGLCQAGQAFNLTNGFEVTYP